MAEAGPDAMILFKVQSSTQSALEAQASHKTDGTRSYAPSSTGPVALIASSKVIPNKNQLKLSRILVVPLGPN